MNFQDTRSRRKLKASYFTETFLNFFKARYSLISVKLVQVVFVVTVSLLALYKLCNNDSIIPLQTFATTKNHLV